MPLCLVSWHGMSRNDPFATYLELQALNWKAWRMRKVIARVTEDIVANALGGIVSSILVLVLLWLTSRLSPNYIQPLWDYLRSSVPIPRWSVLIAVLALGYIIIGTILNSLRILSHKHSAEEIKKLTNLPILASLPLIKHNYYSESEVRGLLMPIDSHWKSSLMERFRRLRRAIKKGLSSQTKVLMITSAQPSEGKSTVCVNLAISLALTGKKVTLIDLDLRRPRLHMLLRVSNTIGFTSILTQNISLEDVIQKTTFENLRVLTSGPVPLNPTELLDQPRASEVINTLREISDYVLIDSAPAVSFVDAEVCADFADITVLVTTQSTNKRLLTEVLEKFKEQEADVLGIILNKCKGMDNRRSMEYSYTGYYSSYYLTDEDNGTSSEEDPPKA